MEKTNRNVIRRDTSGFKSLLREKGITIDEISHEAAASTGKSHNTINGHIKGYGLSKSISAEEIRAFSEILETPVETIKNLLGNDIRDEKSAVSSYGHNTGMEAPGPAAKAKTGSSVAKRNMADTAEWYRAVPEKLEKARRNAGVSRATIGASVNKNRTYYWKWMQGTRLRANAAQTIAELLDVETEEIFVPADTKAGIYRNSDNNKEEILYVKDKASFAPTANAVSEETGSQTQGEIPATVPEWNTGIPEGSANQPSLLCVEAGNNVYYCVGKYDKAARNFVELSYNFSEGDAYKGLSAKTQIVGNVKCWKQI